MTVTATWQKETLLSTLGIEVVESTKERAVVRMPVGPKVHQPYGLLHGGASVVLAETAATLGGLMQIDREKEMVVGLEINANHLRGKRDGTLTALPTPVHVARTTPAFHLPLTH